MNRYRGYRLATGQPRKNVLMDRSQKTFMQNSISPKIVSVRHEAKKKSVAAVLDGFRQW